MRVHKLIIHNFRSICDAEILLEDYTLIVGENNSGKSNIITAIRAFYEDEGIKYKESTDFPKISSPDNNESYVEMHYITGNEEQENLKDEYKSKDKILKVRRYFKSDEKGLVSTNQSNIYGYENGKLSNNLFYGAKNISSAKLGNVIYMAPHKNLCTSFGSGRFPSPWYRARM
ncbi:MAG: AAA family ATPase [bacterium]|nr:AAA family ATPase [bacterium]